MTRKIAQLIARETQWRQSGATSPDGRPLAHLVFFEPESWLVPAGYHSLITAHARFLHEHPARLAVLAGHSYGSGSHRFYWLMGERRAAAVQHALVKAGAAPAQLKVRSDGGLRPMIELAGPMVTGYCRRVSIEHVRPDHTGQTVPDVGSTEWWRAVMGRPASASRLPEPQRLG